MHVLVTGHDGFIGQNLIQALQDAGHTVEGVRVCPRLLDRYDAIVHLSAISGIQACTIHPAEAYSVNVDQTADMLERVRRYHPDTHFIFTSSRAVEADPLSVYGATKLACEAMIRAYTHSYGMRTSIVRLANVYGPHSAHKTSVVAQFIQAALQGEPLRIIGDGTQRRDFIYVGDVVEGILRLLKQPLPGVALNGPREMSVNELVAMIRNLVGTTVGVEYTGRKDIISSQSARSPSTAIAGWTPQTTLLEGLPLTIAWFRDFLKKDSSIPLKIS